MIVSTSRSSHQHPNQKIRVGKRDCYLSADQDKIVTELVLNLNRLRKTTTEAAYLLRRSRIQELIRKL